MSLGAVPEELASSRSFYFIRSRPGKLEYDELDSALDLGVLGEGPSLRMLEQTLSHVFMPMLMQMTGAGASEGAAGAAAAAPDHGANGTTSGAGHKHRELLGNMQKFLTQVSQALQQLNGDVTLPMPETPINIDSVEVAAKDSELVMLLEHYMSEWVPEKEIKNLVEIVHYTYISFDILLCLP